MGKINKKRKIKTAQSKPNANDNADVGVLPGRDNLFDTDMSSVRSSKTVTHRLGIKKQLSKADKMKVRKELLKKKIQVQRDLKESKANKRKAAALGDDRLDFSGFDFYDESNKRKETTLKGSTPKRRKRQKDFTRDVNYLKLLITKKLKTNDKSYVVHND